MTQRRFGDILEEYKLGLSEKQNTKEHDSRRKKDVYYSINTLLGR